MKSNPLIISIMCVSIICSVCAYAESYVYYGERTAIVNGDKNVVITGDDVTIDIEKILNADLSCFCGTFIETGVNAIVDNYVYGIVAPINSKALFYIYATNNNDIAVKIDNVYVDALDYRDVEDPVFFEGSIGTEGEVKAQIYNGKMPKKGLEKFQYAGMYDPYDAAEMNLSPEGTYVRLNPGEGENIVLITDSYKSGIYRFVIRLDYTIGSEKRTFTSDEFELYFENEDESDPTPVGDYTYGVLLEYQMKKLPLPQSMIDAIIYNRSINSENIKIEAHASSILKSKKYSYKPSNVLSGDSSLAWVEGVDGVGVGEWIQLDFSDSKAVFEINIDVGYHKSQDIYSKNSTPTKIKVEFSDGASQVVDIPYAKDLRDAEMTICFTEPHITEYVRIYVLEIHEGTKYDDTCISYVAIS